MQQVVDHALVRFGPQGGGAQGLGVAPGKEGRPVGLGQEADPAVDGANLVEAAAVNAAGFLCERADLATFSGDIVAWIKQRIGTASLVIADLSGANANVYLEVGYAWGLDIPTILLVKDPEELKFDVKGQRCLIYKRIKDLEELLAKELEHVKATVNLGGHG